MSHQHDNDSDRQPATPDRAEYDLFNQPPDEPAPLARDASDREKFVAFHEANPVVLETMIREARRWMQERPGAPLGIDLLVGRVRWVLTMKLQKDGDGFRINDHYAPAYSRLVMHHAPDTAGLFNLRRTQWADDYIADVREGRAA